MKIKIRATKAFARRKDGFWPQSPAFRGTRGSWFHVRQTSGGYEGVIEAVHGKFGLPEQIVTDVCRTVTTAKLRTLTLMFSENLVEYLSCVNRATHEQHLAFTRIANTVSADSMVLAPADGGNVMCLLRNGAEWKGYEITPSGVHGRTVEGVEIAIVQ